MKKILPSLVKALKKHQTSGKSLRAIIGFDGYVNTIQKIIKSKNNGKISFYNSISEVAEQLMNLAGENANIELRHLETKLGGIAPTLANSLAALNIKSVCVGTMGYPDLNSAFEEMHPNCELVTIAAPAKTNTLEFADGKLIFSEESTFQQLTWSYIAALAGIDNIGRWIYESHLVAFANWANIIHSTDIWRGILNDIVMNLAPSSNHKPVHYFTASKSKISDDEDEGFGMRYKNFFFDFANLLKHSNEEILEALEVVKEYTPYGKVSLSLTEKDAIHLYGLLGGEYADERELTDIAKWIYDNTHIHQIVVSGKHSAVVALKNREVLLKGSSSIQERVSTGGFEHLNAGFCLGLLLDLTVEQTTALALANYELYLINGASPEFEDLIQHLIEWEKEFH
ncbi:hypothetical protein [Arcicella rigui]|uniref:Uncharacterized protein n=1 Tax=Arcicella rigui TaxID=797020 RepID=A0ABU5Q9U9_9BACT|nr:hypothetical protein [Arcicella rigui]MEA5139377.1 hypothetical protein [Arcicella rigui]